MAVKPSMHNTDVIRNTQICQRSKKIRQYNTNTAALRLNISTML
jgi:hypothetical protein